MGFLSQVFHDCFNGVWPETPVNKLLVFHQAVDRVLLVCDWGMQFQVLMHVVIEVKSSSWVFKVWNATSTLSCMWVFHQHFLVEVVRLSRDIGLTLSGINIRLIVMVLPCSSLEFICKTIVLLQKVLGLVGYVVKNLLVFVNAGWTLCGSCLSRGNLAGWIHSLNYIFNLVFVSGGNFNLGVCNFEINCIFTFDWIACQN